MPRSNRSVFLILFVAGFALLFACNPSVRVLVHDLLPIRFENPRYARRSQCLNRLRNLSTLFQNYAVSRNGALPLARARPEGVDVSWRVEMLATLDQTTNRMYQNYDFGLAWNAKPNDAFAKTEIPGYRCPQANPASGAYYRATYVVVTGEETAWPADGIRLDDISRADGMANTILIGERHHDRPVWSEPRDAVLPDLNDGLPNIRLPDNADELTVFSSSHGSVSVIFVDGHGATLSANIDPAVLRALLTANGGETIEEGGF